MFCVKQLSPPDPLSRHLRAEALHLLRGATRVLIIIEFCGRGALRLAGFRIALEVVGQRREAHDRRVRRVLRVATACESARRDRVAAVAADRLACDPRRADRGARCHPGRGDATPARALGRVPGAPRPGGAVAGPAAPPPRPAPVPPRRRGGVDRGAPVALGAVWRAGRPRRRRRSGRGRRATTSTRPVVARERPRLRAAPECAAGAAGGTHPGPEGGGEQHEDGGHGHPVAEADAIEHEAVRKLGTRAATEADALRAILEEQRRAIERL